MKPFRSLWVVFCCSAVALPQAVVEHALTTAASSAGTAATSGVGKAAGAVLNSAKTKSSIVSPDKPANASADKPGSTAAAKLAPSTSPSSGQPAAPTPPDQSPVRNAPKFDPSQITIGLDSQELIRRCGEPAMSLSQVKGSLVDIYEYFSSQGEFEVIMKDGIVTSVTRKVSSAQERR